MADFKFDQKNITSLVSAVPTHSLDTKEYGLKLGMNDVEVNKFISNVGIKKIHRANHETTSDYCYQASLRALDLAKLDPSDIDALIFVTQTPDYILPKTSTILQNRLGLRKDVFVLDINDGCSGYIYGLITAFTICNETLPNILLLVGDTPSKQIGKHDKSSTLLFGDGGSATVIQFDKTRTESFIFSQGVNGKEYDSIIIPDGGYRNPFTSKSLEAIESGNNIRNSTNTKMNGDKVFLFGINFISKQLRQFQNDLIKHDWIVLHQANKMMIDRILAKTNWPEEKSLESIAQYGNTSSLSIPLSICLNKEKISPSHKLIIAGFGVGLSWGFGSIQNLNNTKIEIINV